MRQIVFLFATCLLLTGCGLKKPLQNPDTVYPSEPDCACEED